MEMFRAGELNRHEERFLNEIMLNPENTKRGALYYKTDMPPYSYVSNQLNLRITLAGGDASIKGRK
ncbi:MAG: hypothetical protein EOO61_04500 [Hymenobacter sp.]|nr:MAG: hypothetical protein EOO61_04500 [Hymenobacter sp.]